MALKTTYRDLLQKAHVASSIAEIQGFHITSWQVTSTAWDIICAGADPLQQYVQVEPKRRLLGIDVEIMPSLHDDDANLMPHYT